MRRLSGWDAYMLYSETPTVHNHTLKVAVFGPDRDGRSLTFESFRENLEEALPRLMPLCFELVSVPLGLHHPMWRENCSVDLQHHLRRVTAAAPGDRQSLDAVVGAIASSPLDRRRPLWTMHVVDGLDHGRVAVVAKVHHALADGIASANLLAKAVQPDLARPPDRGLDEDPPPTRREVVSAGLRDNFRTTKSLPAVLMRTVRGIRRLRRDATPAPWQDARLMRSPATFLNQSLSARRAFGTSTLSLPVVKEVSRALGVSINDVVLALAAGALRELLLENGEQPAPLLGAVAVATDRDPDRISGNRLATLMASLPVDEPDAIERCRRVHRSTAAAKSNLDLLGPRLIQDWMEYLPPRTASAAFRLASSRKSARSRLMNLPLSNVPGPREIGYVAGFPMVDLYSAGPLYNRCALNITVWSYVDQLNVSVLSDPSVVADPAQVADLMAVDLGQLRSQTRELED